MGSEGVLGSPIYRIIKVTRVDDLVRFVTLHATVMASGSLTYLVGCGIASNDSYQVCYLRSVWCLQRPQVMLSWCCGIVESLVIVAPAS